MKIPFVLLAVSFSVAVAAQEPAGIKPAAKGVVYGETVTGGQTIDINELQAKLTAGAFEGKITGTVKEVCKEMGCWMKLQKADGTTVLVKTKDHAYFMPQNLVGKTVVVDGTASVKEVSEAARKHLAEDAGKSEADIKKIKGSAQELQVIAKGVAVLN